MTFPQPENQDSSQPSPYAGQVGGPETAEADGTFSPVAGGTMSPPVAPFGAAPIKERMNPWVAGGIGAVVGVVATAAIFGLAILSNGTSMNSAVEQIDTAVTACDNPDGITIVDDGEAVIFDNQGEEDYSGASVEEIACVLIGLEMPSYVIDQMSRTTALAGNQTTSWDNYEVQWTYHPDRGLDGVISVIDDS